jgi:hypothetical protein
MQVKNQTLRVGLAAVCYAAQVRNPLSALIIHSTDGAQELQH